MLPDYLPNVHPLLVHFPITLLVLGVTIDISAVVMQRRPALRDLASVLVLLGAVSLIPTYLAGRQAADLVVSPFDRTDLIVSQHADAAWLVLWFFLGIGLARAVLVWRGRLSGWRHVVVAMVGAVGLALLIQAADKGGRLVYELGVGVRPVVDAPAGAFDPPPAPDLGELGPQTGADNSFNWSFKAGSEMLLEQFVTIVSGAPLLASVESRRSALVLEITPIDPILLVFGEVVADVRVGVMVNLDDFDGTFGVLHHVAGSDSYDLLMVENGNLALARHRHQGDSTAGDATVATLTGWHLIEAVGVGGHFRGYLDGELVVHGHTDEGPAGRAGLLIEGTGRVRIDDLRVRPLNE